MFKIYINKEYLYLILLMLKINQNIIKLKNQKVLLLVMKINNLNKKMKIKLLVMKLMLVKNYQILQQKEQL